MKNTWSRFAAPLKMWGCGISPKESLSTIPVTGPRATLESLRIFIYNANTLTRDHTLYLSAQSLRTLKDRYHSSILRILLHKKRTFRFHVFTGSHCCGCEGQSDRERPRVLLVMKGSSCLFSCRSACLR